MEMVKNNLLVALLVFMGFIVYLLLPPSKVSSIDPALNAEAHANSPECLGLPAEPADIDTEIIYSKKELEKDAEVARKCWEAKVRYIKTIIN